MPYIVESGLHIREVSVVYRNAGFLVVQFADTGGRIQVRESRVFESKEQAAGALHKREPQQTEKSVVRNVATPYDFQPGGTRWNKDY